MGLGALSKIYLQRFDIPFDIGKRFGHRQMRQIAMRMGVQRDPLMPACGKGRRKRLWRG